MFKYPFSFNGRIRRLEYALSYAIYFAVIFTVATLLSLVLDRSNPITFVLVMSLVIVLAWFLIAQRAKRCHDRGNSGWWQFIPFYSLWMLFADGEIGDNEYGENPKEWNDGTA
jgi:uncharacterized membrane protein YhaH (DUF805 family)